MALCHGLSLNNKKKNNNNPKGCLMAMADSTNLGHGKKMSERHAEWVRGKEDGEQGREKGAEWYWKGE